MFLFRNTLLCLLLSIAVTACTHAHVPLTLQRCEFTSPRGVVYLERSHQWFGRLDLVLLNNEGKSIKGAIVDVTPWAPSWMPHRSVLHHSVSVYGLVKPHVAAAVTHKLNAEDYLYLVDIKWEAACAIRSVRFTDGTAWKNPLLTFLRRHGETTPGSSSDGRPRLLSLIPRPLVAIQPGFG
jgi:hypothetical protein